MTVEVSATAAHAASVVVVLVVALALERRWPAFGVTAGRAGSRRLARNTVLAVLVLATVFLVLAPLKHWGVDHRLWTWPDLPLPVVVVVSLVVLDLVDYTYHRTAHVTWLWRFHQVHHLDAAFDSTTTLRIHPGDLFLGGAVHVPVIVLLGLPIEGIVAYNLVFFPLAVLHHSNGRLPVRLQDAAARLIVVPRFHMTHHQADIPNTNSNYGSILTLWDHLFRSANPARRDRTWTMGVDYSPDLDVGALLALPARPQQGYATGPATGATGHR